MATSRFRMVSMSCAQSSVAYCTYVMDANRQLLNAWNYSPTPADIQITSKATATPSQTARFSLILKTFILFYKILRTT